MESPLPSNNAVRSSWIDRFYLILKGHYFLFFSAFGTLYPILSITLRSRGLTTQEIALMNLIIPFLVFFSNPLIGFFADKSRRYILTFNIILALVTILYSIMFYLPSIHTEHIQAKIQLDDTNRPTLNFCSSQEMATNCESRSTCGCTYQANCTSYNNQSLSFSFSMDPTEIETATNHHDRTSCAVDYRIPVEKEISSDLIANIDENLSVAQCHITCSIGHFCQGLRHSNQFVYVLLYSSIFALGTNLFSNTITLGASIGYAVLPRPDIFGEQRVWGTIGFGLSAFAASRIYAYFKSDFVYIIMFAVTTCLCIILTCFIRIPEKKKTSTTTNHNEQEEMINVSTSTSQNQDIQTYQPRFKAAALIPLIKQFDVIIFLSLTFIWGISYAALDPYLYLYVDELSPCQSHSIVGWMSLISASAEVFALFFAGRVLKTFGTNFSSVIILIAFAIRFGGYHFIRRPYFLLFMETMHFFNFGILYVLISQKADAIAPPGLSGTLQGLVYGVSFGLGRGVGLIASSFIYTRFESRFLFLVFSISNGIAAVLYTFYFLWKSLASPPAKRIIKNTNIPKIVIESETNINEEPMLSSGSIGKLDG